MKHDSKKENKNYKVIAENRRARYDYTIIDTIEAGIVLKGTEVKSLRGGGMSITEAYAGPKEGHLYIFNVNIPVYQQASALFNHEPKRPRQLLLKRKEEGRLLSGLSRDGITLIPLCLYFNHRGMAKLSIGLAKGRKKEDKRAAEKERDWQRDKQRLLRNRG
jgi:SsrA-binding protein